MQQNQPIPKLSVGEVFYARQIWLYNLTFVRHDQTVQNTDNIFIYTWLETQSGRGSNEVSSALVYYLSKLEKDLITERGAKCITEQRLYCFVLFKQFYASQCYF